MIPYSEENLESRWYREYSITLHKRKLQSIKDRSNLTITSPIRFSSVNRKKIANINKKAKERYRENMILYEKLTQISERKYSPTWRKGPKSLNISTRKKEAERIIHDNLEFIKRLTEKPSFVSARKLKEEYQIAELYKRNISKANLHERLKKIKFNELKPLFLPPITQEVAVKNLEMSKNESYSVNEYNSKIVSVMENPESPSNDNKSIEIEEKKNKQKNGKNAQQSIDIPEGNPKNEENKNNNEKKVAEVLINEDTDILKEEKIELENIEKNDEQSLEETKNNEISLRESKENLNNIEEMLDSNNENNIKGEILEKDISEEIKEEADPLLLDSNSEIPSKLQEEIA